MKVLAMWDDTLLVWKIVNANDFENVVKVFHGYPYNKEVPEIIKKQISKINMKTKPMLFSTEMIQANLAGRKTNTRRIVDDVHTEFLEWAFKGKKNLADWISRNAKHKMGDVIWVRETFCFGYLESFLYKATDTLDDDYQKWSPSIHMPKEAARLFLRILNVNVQRLQDITNEEALVEGIKLSYTKNEETGEDLLYCFDYLENKLKFISPVASFKTLWQKINGKDSWNENPFVWVYEYEITEKPENFLP